MCFGDSTEKRVQIDLTAELPQPGQAGKLCAKSTFTAQTCVSQRRRSCDVSQLATLRSSLWQEKVLREASASETVERINEPLPARTEVAPVPPCLEMQPSELMQLFAPMWQMVAQPDMWGGFQQGGFQPAPAPVPEVAAKKKKKRVKKAKVMPSAQDGEVTLMLRHLPTKYTPSELLESFESFLPHINFYYLPTNFETKKNLGYAFLNFNDKEAAEEFKAFWPTTGIPESEESPVEEARVQGFEANVARFRNSSVMAVLPEEAKPYLFTNGVREAFPEPEKELPGIGPRFRPTGE